MIKRELPGIEYADLLTLEESEKLPKSLLYHNNSWWLRDSCCVNGIYALVVCANSVHYSSDVVCTCKKGVRPVLRLRNTGDYKVGDDFKFGRKWFRIIDERTAFCLDDIGTCMFDSFSCNYAVSDIKQFIQNWLIASLEKL